MKIAIFTDTYTPEINGIVTSIVNFSERLVKRGHKIYIFAPKYPGKNPKVPKGIKVIRFKAFSFKTNKATKIAFPSMVKIIKDLREIEPDVIHVQTPMNIGVTGVMASKILDIPNIQTYHTYIPDFLVYLSPKKVLGLEGFYEHLRDAKVIKDIIESEPFQELTKMSKKGKKNIDKFFDTFRSASKKEKSNLSDKFAWEFTRFLYNRADLVLAPSNALVESLRKNKVRSELGFQSNGIEYNLFKKKDDYKIRGKLIHVGRLGLEKGVDIVVKAMKELVKTHPDAILDIYGDGPAKKDLEEMVKELKLEKNVIFKGFITRKELAKEYRNYDFFVTASPIETQGIVILEAMSAGLPVVGANKLAIPEIVKNGNSGYLARAGSPKSHARMMKKLLTTPKLNKKLGDGANEIALSHHIYGEVEKIENYYMEVVFKHKNRY